MIRIFLLLTVAISTYTSTNAQTMGTDSLPFATIPDYPDSYSAAHVLARSIDGLGFRYYWATSELRSVDYSYAAGNDSRSIDETMDHLWGLSDMIMNTVLGKANKRPRPETSMTRVERRAATLANLKAASDYLHTHGDADLSEMAIIFQRGENTSEVPLWHLINGPIADALWHCGQVVAHRRAAGNPLPPGVNVFMGTKK